MVTPIGATTDINHVNSIWYRLSRRGPDFLIESSNDGVRFSQMRIFHIHSLGETTCEMGKATPPLSAKQPVKFGVYACSPVNSKFKAKFTNIKTEFCIWKAHLSD